MQTHASKILAKKDLSPPGCEPLKYLETKESLKYTPNNGR